MEITELALERTHLVLICTTFSIMTAGVALDNGMAYLHEQRVAQDIALLKNAQFIGLFLTSFGTILLFVEIYQFIRRNKQLVALKLAKAPVFTSSVMLSVLVLA